MAYGFQAAGRKRYRWKRENKTIVGLGVHAERFAVEKKLHGFGIRDHVDRLHRRPDERAHRITPMAQNMKVRLIVLHHAVREINFLRQANRVHLAADAANFA